MTTSRYDGEGTSLIPSPEHQSEMAILHLRLAETHMELAVMGVQQVVLAVEPPSNLFALQDVWSRVRMQWQIAYYGERTLVVRDIEHLIGVSALLKKVVRICCEPPERLSNRGILWDLTFNHFRVVGIDAMRDVRAATKT